MKWKEGGQGLVNIRASILKETAGLQEYIKKMPPSDELPRECFWQQKPSNEEEPEGLSWKDRQGTSKLKMYHTRQDPDAEYAEIPRDSPVHQGRVQDVDREGICGAA